MASRQQAGQRQFDLLWFAKNDFVDLLQSQVGRVHVRFFLERCHGGRNGSPGMPSACHLIRPDKCLHLAVKSG